MKKIIKDAIVIYPAFRSEVTLMTNQESRILVVIFKFNYGKVVSLHECAKFCVIIIASRARNPCVIVKLAGYWHAENQWPRVNCC